MSRYYIKFYKEKDMRYISHLDLLRLFKRSFKRVGIKLQYSQGFNPHPKMSFAQPLSLGFASVGEYLEFETINIHSTDEIQSKINSILPVGIGIITCQELTQEGKTLAALTHAADYKIQIPIDAMPLIHGNIDGWILNFLNQNQILIQKMQKKSGKEIDVDIRPMIQELSGKIVDNCIMLTCRIDAGSQSNLNPEFVLTTFMDYCSIPFDRSEVVIQRLELYY